MTQIQKDRLMTKLNTGLTAYIATLATAVTVLVGIIYNDMRGDIADSRVKIQAVESKANDVALGLASSNITIMQHTKQIDGLYDLLGGQPTFRGYKAK